MNLRTLAFVSESNSDVFFVCVCVGGVFFNAILANLCNLRYPRSKVAQGSKLKLVNIARIRIKTFLFTQEFRKYIV